MKELAKILGFDKMIKLDYTKEEVKVIVGAIIMVIVALLADSI